MGVDDVVAEPLPVLVVVLVKGLELEPPVAFVKSSLKVPMLLCCDMDAEGEFELRGEPSR
jgi:hypothetical protein